MQNLINRFWHSKKAWICFLGLFLFATFPGKGGFEGAQREISSLSMRNDNWGFITPYYFGEFPNFGGYWRFILVLIQISAVWICIFFLVKNLNFKSTKSKIVFLTYFIIVSVFSSQLWRDSTLFCFVIFGLGILKVALTSSNSLKWLLTVLGILAINFGLMFKPIFAILYLVFIIILLIENSIPEKVTLLIIVALISLPFSPYTIDKYLGYKFNLQHVYPEQQPMIYDMAAIYCWGNTDKSRLQAAEVLKLVLKPKSELSSVCSYQILTSWDSLHTNRADWNISAPVERITNSKTKFDTFKNLWQKTVLLNIREYIMAKKPFLAEVLTMGNSFVKPQNSVFGSFEILHSLNMLIWTIFYYFAIFFDKTRLLTVGFSILFFISYFFLRALRSNISFKSFLKENFKSILLFSNVIFLGLIATIAFVANNGRYVLPVILTTWLFTFRILFKSKAH